MKQPTSKLLFFGSFNPIHLGHITMVELAQQYLNISTTLFVLSPQNPFKQKDQLLNFNLRFSLLKEAQRDFPFIVPCDIEKNMPPPNYTYKTIEIFKQLYPKTQLFLLIGTDNWASFHLWKKHQEVLKNTTLVVYPRTTTIFDNPNIHVQSHKIIFLKNVPLIDISASMVRKRIINKQEYIQLLPKKTYQKIQEFGLYKE